MRWGDGVLEMGWGGGVMEMRWSGGVLEMGWDESEGVAEEAVVAAATLRIVIPLPESVN